MKTARFGLSVVLGIAMTGGLLTLMYTLIEMGDVDTDEKEPRRIGDIWQEDKVIDENVKKLKPKKPEDPIDPPPEMPRDKLDVEDVVDVVQINMPTLDTKAAIRIGGFGGDGEYIPLVKIQPQYPRRALERGIEGHVIVEFTISVTGSIINPRVVEAIDAKGRATKVFDRAAIKAANKLKYKPRVIDGVAMEVTGVLHKFTFQLEKDK